MRDKLFMISETKFEFFCIFNGASQTLDDDLAAKIK